MNIREAREEDLHTLLLLYTQLHDNPMPQETARVRAVWRSIMADANHHVVLAEEDGAAVSSCVLVVVPNLTHGQRPYALVENVVTDAARRGRGLATACLSFAKEIAERAGCYKIMLLTGSKQQSTLCFYERAGYNRQDKTAFIQWLEP